MDIFKKNKDDMTIAMTKDELEKMIESFSKNADFAAKKLNIPVEVAQKEIDDIIKKMKNAMEKTTSTR